MMLTWLKVLGVLSSLKLKLLTQENGHSCLYRAEDVLAGPLPAWLQTDESFQGLKRGIIFASCSPGFPH